MSLLRVEEAVARLDAIDGGDPEGAHSEADNVLLGAVDQRVSDAYTRCVERVGAWWYA